MSLSAIGNFSATIYILVSLISSSISRAHRHGELDRWLQWWG